MTEELLVNVSPMESRVAVLTDGVLSEVYIERHNKLGVVGNIYLGTVVRVLPGMQAAFIDIGQSRTAFLHVNDMRKPAKPTVSSIKDISTINADGGADEVAENILEPSSSATFGTFISNSSGQDMPTKQGGDFESSTHSTMPDGTPTQINQNQTPVNQSSQPASAQEKSENGQLNPNSDLVETAKRTPQLPKLLSSIDVVAKSAMPVDAPAQTLTDEPTQSVSEQTKTDGSHNSNSNVSQAPSKTTKRVEPPASELIQNRLQEGQKILVQVTKDQLGTKGARLTTNISLPSRYLVYLPSGEHIGISQRIDHTEERHRLKTELENLMQTVNLTGGLIARTAAERVSVAKLEEDIYYLVQLWRTILARKNDALYQPQTATLIYQELSLPLRSIRDLVNADTQRVVIDQTQMFEEARRFAREFVPAIYPRIVPHISEQPLFDVYRVEEDLRDALKRRVDLKSGGYLIIDQTEAMTTIDVNTGSYVGGRSLEDTVYKTNLEATYAIARQLRLRNLGGIIILDFIDMTEQEHRDDVLMSLQNQLMQDYAKTKITQVSELGLVEMTRKRTRESLEQQLCEPCQTCQGRGFVKTAETVCFEIFREIMRCARSYNSPKQFTVVAHASVIDLLLSSEADAVADLEYLVGRVITFEVEDLYTQEQYDIVLD